MQSKGTSVVSIAMRNTCTANVEGLVNACARLHAHNGWVSYVPARHTCMHVKLGRGQPQLMGPVVPSLWLLVSVTMPVALNGGGASTYSSLSTWSSADECAASRHVSTSVSVRAARAVQAAVAVVLARKAES
jgi:hypothetical protein